MSTFSFDGVHIQNKCTTKEIRGTSDISISLSVSRHPFSSNGLEMRVVMVTGAEKSPHGPTPPPIHPQVTHTCMHTHIQTHHFSLFSFSCPGIADVTAETMNLTYRSEMHIWAAVSRPETRGGERKKNGTRDSLPERHGVRTSLKFKRESNKTGEEIQNSISKRFAFEGALLLFPFFFSGAIRPIPLKKTRGKGRKREKWSFNKKKIKNG